MSKKGWAAFGVLSLGILAGVLKFTPLSPLAESVEQMEDIAKKAKDNIPDPCPPVLCEAMASGSIQPLDGGVRGICECP